MNLMLSRGLVALSLLTASISGQGGDQSMTSRTQTQTHENLSTALHGEAFAYVKYILYAEKARKEGYRDVAEAFELAAKKERYEHFAELAEHYGLVGTTAENLAEAIAGEVNEATKLYPDFARTAMKDGERSVADRFEELAGDEGQHAKEFASLLRAIDGEGRR